VLTAWRDPKSGTLENFDLVMGDHCAKGGARAALEISSRKNEKAPLSPIVDGEVRLLFRWVLSNLPKAVPADLRALMEKSANGRVAAASAAPAWTAPSAANRTTPPAGPAPNFAPPRPKSIAPGTSPTQWSPPPVKPKG